ncbi:hypothetical protein V3C40_00995 [Janthinobacterium sp. LS2A]|uniref:hypothetical protein n=1 Tax=Janthinobacterium sp. LS2A TaxID=3118590 RepID=UPI002F91E3CE
MPKELEIHSQNSDEVQHGTSICAIPCPKNPQILIFELAYISWDDIERHLDENKIPYKTDGMPFHGANW